MAGQHERHINILLRFHSGRGAYPNNHSISGMTPMFARAILAVAAGAVLTSCANADRLRSNLGGPSTASEIQRNPSKQTFASKVLGAIAFERVTKRKADPARLNQLR